jgi:hypothetical protein
MKCPASPSLLLACLVLVCAAAPASAVLEFVTADIPWQQVEASNTFTVCMEREESSPLDRVSRMVFAVQTGKTGAPPATLAVHWQVRQGQAVIGEKTAPIPLGMLDAAFSLAELKLGRYDVSAELRDGDAVVDRASTFFRLVEATQPPQSGRIALNLPRGVPIKTGTYPISGGVPFPKGALWSEKNVRVVQADGKPVPAQFEVRSRWGHTDATSIRWLGVDFQAKSAPAWWPARKDTRYYLEFGPRVSPAPAKARVIVRETPEGLQVDTGPLQFLVRRAGFNVVDQVRVDGREVLSSTPQAGLYLIDHEGAVYRAANDKNVKLTVEEQGDLRTVIRAEGWYVKDGSAGESLDWKLPTDKLCKQVTRIEAYAGKSYVRVLSTWILTFDSLSVRLKDVGLTLPLTACKEAEFGVEAGAPMRVPVAKEGVRLVQHLPSAFAVETGSGRTLQSGTRSAGWAMAETDAGLVALGYRDTWQRFPKEFEVLPDALKFHVWPAHGRTHPDINPLAADQIHKLWFAHQGAELNMAMPWDYFWAVCDMRNEFRAGIYSGAGQAMAGVQSSAMGAAQTSDLLIHFASRKGVEEVRETAASFQAAPHALPDPAWLCDSLAAGYLQPYEPGKMAVAEEVIENLGKAAWETQNATGDYGMWLYRAWHNGTLKAPGQWTLYRLYNACHHYEAYVPWMLYARSGDPEYLTIGSANMRMLTDMQMIHYDNPDYPQREPWSNGRLVGSTRHTNGFCPWGGDHAILGHPTCYNGVMMAYYLTGDLRLREVLVDEWQNTILTDRANPQFALANRSSDIGREASNSLGELLDLYQMTHHPAILGYLPKVLGLHLRQMTSWGLPNENLVLQYGSEAARNQIVAAVKDYRETSHNPTNSYGLWYDPGIFALASMIDPSSKAYLEAWTKADVGNLRPVARRFRAQEPGAMNCYDASDTLRTLPSMLRAVAKSDGNLSPGALKTPQPMVTRAAIVRKDVDRPFDITLNGTVGEGGMTITVTRPDGQPAISNTVPAGVHKPWILHVPADGLTGDYVISVPRREPIDLITVPLTTLPEVYLPNDAGGKPGWWWQHGAITYFVRSRTDQREPFEISTHGATPASIVSRDGMETLATSLDGKPMTVEVGPEGAWFTFMTVYAGVSQCPILSVSPEKWFLPKQLER